MDIDNKKVDEFIKKLKNHSCPLCDSNQWIIDNKLFYLLEYDPKGINLGGAVFPVIPLTCPKCGNTILINAIISGLIDNKIETKSNTNKNKSDNIKNEKSSK